MLHYQKLTHGHIPLFKGADIYRYSTKPIKPSDVLMIKNLDENATTEQKKVNEELNRLLTLKNVENGIVLRHVARLNTRYELIATRYNRTVDRPFIFDNSLWRFRANTDTTSSQLNAFLGLICSRIVAYLINLFSTNNNVALDDIKAVPMPDIKTLPEEQLNITVKKCLELRSMIQSALLDKYEISMPEVGQEISLPIDQVFIKSPLPKITFNNAILLGLIKVQGQGKVGTLLKNGKIILNSNTEFNGVAAKLLQAVEDKDLSDAISEVRFPDLSSISQWLGYLETQCTTAKEMWQKFSELQHEVDEIIFKWYGLDTISHDAIIEGLPWAKRK